MTLPRAAELYLDELSHLLSPAEPVDRIEIVAGVREHIEASLAATPTPTDADVEAVLADLGSPDAVARASLGESSGPRAGVPPQGTTTPVLERGWVAPTVTILLGLCLLVSLVVAGTAPTSPHLSSPEGALGPLAEFNLLEGAMWALVLWLSLGVWLWVPAIALLWASPRWCTPAKVAGTMLPFVPLAGAGAVAGLPEPAPLAGLLAGLVAALALLAWVARSGWRASAREIPAGIVGGSR